jgi:homocysteine S-methyltransferase
LLHAIDTGEYFVPDANRDDKAGPPVTMQDLEDFHYTRLHSIASNAAWSHVDLVAFETIPRLDEAIAIRRALHRLYAVFPSKASYASFVFPEGHHLPWPVQPIKDGTEDMEKLLKTVVGVDEQGSPSPLTGIGINCTKPKYLTRLVAEMTTTLHRVKMDSKPHLFVSVDERLLCYFKLMNKCSSTLMAVWCGTVSNVSGPKSMVHTLHLSPGQTKSCKRPRQVSKAAFHGRAAL